jgi:hypothetical protein
MVGRGEITDKAWEQIVPLLPDNGRRERQDPLPPDGLRRGDSEGYPASLRPSVPVVRRGVRAARPARHGALPYVRRGLPSLRKRMQQPPLRGGLKDRKVKACWERGRRTPPLPIFARPSKAQPRHRVGAYSVLRKGEFTEVS